MSTFTGANGQGKTNLVEAAAYVATFGSHRVATDAPLIRHGAQRAILRAAVTSAERDSLVEIEINAGQANRVRLNRVPLPAAAGGAGHAALRPVRPGRPGHGQGRPRPAAALSRRPAGRHQAAVRRGPGRLRAGAAAADRAAEVRQAARFTGQGGGAGAARLEVWDEHLVEQGRRADRGAAGADGGAPAAGGQGLRRGVRRGPGHRDELPAGPGGSSRTPSPPRTGRPSPRGCARRWPGSAGPSSSAASAWSARTGTSSSCASGSCLPAATPATASPGRWRSRSGSAAYDLLRSGGDDPVLMLDDVFAELDSGRRERLAALVGGAEQVLVTAAVPADVPARLAGQQVRGVRRGGLPCLTMRPGAARPRGPGAGEG